MYMKGKLLINYHTDSFAFGNALNRAYDASRNNLLDRVQQRIAHAAPLLAHVAAVSQIEAAATAAPEESSTLPQAPVH